MKTKIQQFLGIITADKPVNYSWYLGQLFEYSNNIQSLRIQRIRIRILLFGLNYSNNLNIRGNTGTYTDLLYAHFNIMIRHIIFQPLLIP